jgi:hypothetical protein
LADGSMAPGGNGCRRGAWLGQGREGDRYSGAAGEARQVMLIAQDHLAAIASSVGRAEVGG